MECGLTLEAARSYSLAQLRMVAEAKRRIEARRGLLDLEVMCAVLATFGGKTGPVREEGKRLVEVAEGRG